MMGWETILIAMLAFDAVCLILIGVFLVLSNRELPPEHRQGIVKPLLGIGLFFLFGSGLFYAGIWLLRP